MKIEIIKFKKYFFNNFNKLDNHIQETFYKKLEIIETNDYITKQLKFGEHPYEIRSLRIGKHRFIFILKDNMATFLDVMCRELGYPASYMNKLIKIYEKSD